MWETKKKTKTGNRLLLPFVWTAMVAVALLGFCIILSIFNNDLKYEMRMMKSEAEGASRAIPDNEARWDPGKLYEFGAVEGR